MIILINKIDSYNLIDSIFVLLISTLLYGEAVITNECAALKVPPEGKIILEDRGFEAFKKNSFSYSDPAGGVSFTGTKVGALMISGNHAQFSGGAKLGRRNNVTFTVNVDDVGSCPDDFTIQLSNGYTRSGNLTSGDISIHN